ncbi:MAG: hypothetical protein US49_C0006G0067 [candidate division TM6 bacterium GW2011_GWF2_37_49]|nr:MAG: hypothetical protein US49_C0006G0067 [candidate division TM6 bacterium GW2011_GWF2_37_49]
MKKTLAVFICTTFFGGIVATTETMSSTHEVNDISKHEEVAGQSKDSNTQTKSEVTYLKSGKVRFSSKGYVPKKISGKHMDLMNAVFVENPIAVVRMFKAAIAVKKLLEEIEKMKPLATDKKTGESVYFATKAEEINFIQSRIKGILDPIDKFLDEALDKSRSIVLVLFAKSLGDHARQGYLLPSLDAVDTTSKYLVDNILTIEDLESAISEFFIFFSDINFGLSKEAMESYEKMLKKLQDAQKKQNNNKK